MLKFWQPSQKGYYHRPYYLTLDDWNCLQHLDNEEINIDVQKKKSWRLKKEHLSQMNR